MIVVCALGHQPVTLGATMATREAVPPGDIDKELFSQIYAHEPLYLLAGGRPDADIKFQISFKARLASRVFLGYSALSHWDVSKVSAPFRDTTHRPSLFWYSVRGEPLGAIPMHLAAGYEHQSNGRDNENSRSIDTLFVKPTLIFGKESERHWRVVPKAFVYVGRGSQNRDIANYRGNLELSVANLVDDGWGAGATLRIGRGGRGSIQVDLTQRLDKLGFNVPGYLAVQLFSGYGETLLDYNRKGPTQLRIGYVLDRGH